MAKGDNEITPDDIQKLTPADIEGDEILLKALFRKVASDPQALEKLLTEAVRRNPALKRRLIGIIRKKKRKRKAR